MKGTYWLHSKPISEAVWSLTNTELPVVFPRWPSIGFKTGSSQTMSCPFQSYFSDQWSVLVFNCQTDMMIDIFSICFLLINLSRTIEYFKLLNIVPAEIAVNVLTGCLYIGMWDYIYSPRDYIYNPAKSTE